MKGEKQTGSISLSEIMWMVMPDSQKVTSENLAIWDAEAVALINSLKNAPLKDVVKHFETHPPSAGVVAMLWIVGQCEIEEEYRKRQAATLVVAQAASKESRTAKAAIRIGNLKNAIKDLYLNADGTPNYKGAGWAMNNKEVPHYLVEKELSQGYAERTILDVVKEVVPACKEARKAFDCTQQR